MKKYHHLFCRNDTVVPYSFYDVKEGRYYLHAIVWNSGNRDEEPKNGDFFGYYGTANRTPDSANVVVPSSGEVVFDLMLKVVVE